MTWSDLTADPTLQETLYYMSGLAFIIQPSQTLVDKGYFVPMTYAGFNNGLVYITPRHYKTKEMQVETI